MFVLPKSVEIKKSFKSVREIFEYIVRNVTRRFSRRILLDLKKEK